MDLRAARNSKRVLIAGHRGNWGGNIPPNTIGCLPFGMEHWKVFPAVIRKRYLILSMMNITL